MVEKTEFLPLFRVFYTTRMSDVDCILKNALNCVKRAFTFAPSYVVANIAGFFVGDQEGDGDGLDVIE